MKGEHKSPEMLALNPSGAVPFVQINGEVFNESAATLRLLSGIIGPMAEYYPMDPFKRQKIDMALDFNGTSLRPILLQILAIHQTKMQTG